MSISIIQVYFSKHCWILKGWLKMSRGNHYGIEDYQFSNDEKRILIGANRESIYRHSSRSDYYIYDFEDNRLTSLSENGKQSIPQFSPDGNKVAFVRNNNIYIKNLISGEEFRSYSLTVNGTILLMESLIGFMRKNLDLRLVFIGRLMGKGLLTIDLMNRT
jgi:hypothetical protein